MRFIHTADWHLGRLFHGVHLTQDQHHALSQFVDIVKQAKVDAVLIAGDLYDRAVPPPEAVELLDEMLSRLVLEARTPVVLIAGNHDSPSRLHFASRLLRDQRLYVAGQVDGTFRPVTFDDAFGKIQIYPIPYAEPATVREAMGEGSEAVLCHESAMSAMCDRIRRQRTAGDRAVLIGHAFVAGGAECESERPLSVGGAGTVSVGAMRGFDYVALGHLHAPQVVYGGRQEGTGVERHEGTEALRHEGKEQNSLDAASNPLRASVPSCLRASSGQIRYSGSLLKYSFDEADHVKGIYVVEMDGQGRCAVETVPIKPTRNVRRIEGRMDDLLSGAADAGPREDYVEVMILDEGALIDPVGRLRQVYPNIMHIRRPERASSAVAADRIDVRGKTAIELFSSFFKHVRGTELNPEQDLALKAAVEEVGRREREVG